MGLFRFCLLCLRASMSLVSNACSTEVLSSEFIVAGTSRSEYISDIFCVTGRLRLGPRIRRTPVIKIKKKSTAGYMYYYTHYGIDF